MARNNQKILNYKRLLYSALLEVPYPELTSHEVDIAYALSSDDQIQKFLDEKLAEERVKT